jgi:hypothetical protein
MALSGVPRPRHAVLPTAPEHYQWLWMQQALEMIATELDASIKVREASPQVLLLSPAGKVFKVTVTDAGALTSVEMPQGVPGA